MSVTEKVLVGPRQQAGMLARVRGATVVGTLPLTDVQVVQLIIGRVLMVSSLNEVVVFILSVVVSLEIRESSAKGFGFFENIIKL